jgi:hypothetical protein
VRKSGKMNVDTSVGGSDKHGVWTWPKEAQTAISFTINIHRQDLAIPWVA